MIERIVNYPPKTIEPVKSQKNSQINQNVDINRERLNFNELLKSKIQNQNGITFSAHASARLEQRNIQLSETEKSKLEEAVNKLSEKGGRESLIRVNDISYVVNIPNRTIITAVDDHNQSDNIFTNIDSAMIVN